MFNILLSGASGKMGNVIARLSGDYNCKIIAGYDIVIKACEFPVFDNIDCIDVNPDVIIDFSNPAALSSVLQFAIKTKTPAVIATTGLSASQIDEIKNASLHIPMFFSANMSVGINLISELAKQAATLLSDNFDIEIIEKHHNQKLDAPSGTALLLADEISSCMSQSTKYVYDRHIKREKRSKNEIGIHAVRGGTIVGEHEVIFAGNDEIVSISHSATSKEIFAVGALRAANFLADKSPGLYNMKDLVSTLISK